VTERTLMAAIIPPGATHTDSILSVGFEDEHQAWNLVLVAGVVSSLLSDFLIRAVPKDDIRRPSFDRLAVGAPDHPAVPGIVLRSLRLNCLTAAYGVLWRHVLERAALDEQWTGGIEYPGRRPLADVKKEWTVEAPLRRASDRRQALVELDALVALSMGLPVDQLCTIYRTQFPVLYGYDRKAYTYDANGRHVPNSVQAVWRRKRDRIMDEERAATNASGNTYTYELPFVTLDREADMRTAYAEFERRLKERTGG
jgi:hypothetical protein